MTADDPLIKTRIFLLSILTKTASFAIIQVTDSNLYCLYFPNFSLGGIYNEKT